MEHKHSVFDTDTHFVIAKDTREIKLESSAAPVIVQRDHNSERLSFELPRYIDGHDMTLCNEVQVHYLNVDSSTKDAAKGVYSVKDLGVLESDSNTAVCSWLISENATQYAGKLNFMIRFSCIADDGSVSYRWNTGIYSELSVVSGYDNGEAVTEDFPDILAQWKAELFGIGDTQEQRLIDVSTAQQAAIAAKGEEVLEEAEAQKNAVTARGEAVMASIPADYSALSALADHNRRNKAGAIVLNAQGESILLNDASEYPVTGLKVFGKSEQFTTTGKNLLSNATATRTTYEVTATPNEDGSITVDGTATGNAFFELGSAELEPGTYVLNGCPSGGAVATYCMYTLVDGQYIWNIGSDKSFTLEEAKTVTVNIRIMSGVTVNKLEFYPMISVDGGEYEPYTGGVASPSPEYPQEINSVENPALTLYGKNLLDISQMLNVNLTESNGVYTLTRNEGGERFSGVASISIPANIPFKISLNMTGATNSSARLPLYFKGENGGTYYASLATEYSCTYDDKIVSVGLYLASSEEVGSYVAFTDMQIEIGETATEYEPYKEPQTATIPRTLPGIPVSSGGNYTDENGQQWICDEVDLERGVYIQRVGTQTFNNAFEFVNVSSVDGSGVFYCGLAGYDTASYTLGMMSDQFRFAGYNTHNSDAVGNLSAGEFSYIRNTTAGARIYFAVAGVTTKEEATAFLADHLPTVHFPLKTPVETVLTDAEITAYKALCTNKPNTTILNDAGAYMAVEYVADTKTYIDNKIAELMAQ